MATPRSQLSEDLVRRLAASLRAAQLYSPGHPLIARNIESFTDAVRTMHRIADPLVIGIVADELIVGDYPVGDAAPLAALVRRLRQLGIERITIESGVERDEIEGLTAFVSTARPEQGGRTADAPNAPATAAAFPEFPHVRVGRLTTEERTEAEAGDMAAIRELYDGAVRTAEAVWESARLDRRPDPLAAQAGVEGLAEAVSENRSALLALTALREYDTYTFTHMVNVSILTMAQARALGVEGALLREFGLAGLMHDIGKVQTPLEILNKTETLTGREFGILKRHPVDGAAILRSTPDMPALAPVVAFEHHLRMDGSGYPSVSRLSLNLATRLCSIADVYDAMRSQRAYQGSFPTDRILAVLKQNDGRHFDRDLVRRFAQLLGVYPIGTVVALSTGEIALVIETHAPDPFRPRVRLLLDRQGSRLARTRTINLWEAAGEGAAAAEVASVVDPASLGLDPLALL
jgi:putative nucleotidyltransferase with HDIG domain